MQSTRQGPRSPNRSLDHLLDDELLNLKFDWQPRAERKEDANGDGRASGSRQQSFRSSTLSNSTPMSESRAKTSHLIKCHQRRTYRSSGVNQHPNPNFPVPQPPGMGAAGQTLHTPKSPRKAFIGSLPPGSQKTQASNRIFKTAALLLQLKKLDAGRRKDFRGRADDMPISVLDESFAVHLEKMGFSEMEIENSSKGLGLVNLPELSDDGIGKKAQLDAAPFTLWANGAKIRLTPKEKKLISQAWAEMDHNSVKLKQKAVHSNYPISPRKTNPQNKEYLVAPAIWRDVKHQQTIELKKSQLLLEREGISSSTNIPSVDLSWRPATAPVPQSLGRFSGDWGIAGEGGGAMARPTTCPASFAPLGSSAVPQRLLRPSTSKAAAEPPKQEDGSLPQHEQEVPSQEDTLNLYSSGVYRNYLWRRGYRIPKPYIPTSHTWENPAPESDDIKYDEWETTVDIPQSEVSYNSSPRFI